MAKVKHFVVLGLGSFGGALARKLKANGCRVTGVDVDRDHIDALKDVLYEAVIGDVTDRKLLEQLAIKDANAVIIALAEDISRSLLAALHVRELGARKIVVKGVSAEHEKILKHMKVDEVVFPDRDMAAALADRMTWPNVLDYFAIDPDYSIAEIAVPESCVGRTLQEADLRRRFGIWVLGVKDSLTTKLTLIPDAAFRLTGDQMLVVVGKHEGIDNIRELA